MKRKLRLMVLVFVCALPVLLLQYGVMFARTVKNKIKIQELPVNMQTNVTKVFVESFKQYFISEPVSKTNFNYTYFDPSFKLTQGMVYTWTQINNTQKTCDDSFVLYGNRFAELHDVIMDTSYINRPFSKGGQNFKEVIMSHLDKESNWVVRPGFWTQRCNDTKSLNVNGVAVPFYKSLSMIPQQTNATISDSRAENVTVISNFTVAISRGDYWNLHQYMMHCLDTFLMMVLYSKKPGEVSLLLVDGHPELFIYDNTWRRVFGPVLRAGHFEHPVIFKRLIWGIKEGFSPIALYQEEKVHYLEEFRDFFLQQNGVSNASSLDCSRIKITLIIRRNYISRIGNIPGNVERKIFNEGEVIAALKTVIPESIVSGRIMDSAPMEDQVAWISKTDILVGVHGAGMTHTLFLPRHAGIFEIFPLNFQATRPWYCVYEAVARWRSLPYISWTNTSPQNEIEGGFIYIPVETLIANVKQLYRRICPKTDILI
ncbi:hypothetical protein ACJMK2_002507 [Sinanodonta woodiana]|uniref:Glycosyltransferase 61 catalytic domain-containing protein n=1 Tax=Sinanodonta woodiana TaxID=1069815 RepID=A0ABD3XX54_SINWO